MAPYIYLRRNNSESCCVAYMQLQYQGSSCCDAGCLHDIQQHVSHRLCMTVKASITQISLMQLVLQLHTRLSEGIELHLDQQM